MLTKRGDDGVEAAGQRHGGDASPAGRLLPAIRCPLPRLLRRQPYPSPEGIWDRRLRHCCDDLSKRGCSGSRFYFLADRPSKDLLAIQYKIS
nr:uncharacterized protein LOC127314848 isoform X5 [Lolium perenne]